MVKLKLFSTLVALAAALAPVSAFATPLVERTLVPRDGSCVASWNGTNITGAVDGGACRYTIRYGDARRWEYSVPPANQSDVQADAFPPMCPQPQTLEGMIANRTQSEDCLFFTVYTPQNVTANSSLPVLFFLHGGSYYQGAITDSGLNGSVNAVQENIITVFAQYRLAILGFVPPKIAPASPDPNFSLLDVVLGLSVVRDNIAAVGGDPSAVTIGGQSAGGSMIMTLWGTPRAKGLFRGMIMQSTPFSVGTTSPNQTAGLQDMIFGNASLPNCTDFACYQNNVSVETILAMQEHVNAVGPSDIHGITYGEVFKPQFGTVTLPRDPMNALFNNASSLLDFSSVPLMITSTRNESGYIVQQGVTTATTASTAGVKAGLMKVLLNETEADGIINSGHYPLVETPDGLRTTLEIIMTDYGWRCSGRQVGNKWAAQGVKVWMAEWNQGVIYPFAAKGNYCKEEGVVCHGSDVYPTFGTPPNITANYTEWEPSIRNYWSSFIKHGDPTAGGLEWPQWTSNSTIADMGNLGGGHGIPECPADFWGVDVPWWWQSFSNETITTLGEAPANATPTNPFAPNSSEPAGSGSSGATAGIGHPLLAVTIAIVLGIVVAV